MLSEIDERDLAVLMSHTSFRMAQLLLIKKRFEELDLGGKGYVTVQDLVLGVPNLANHAMS